MKKNAQLLNLEGVDFVARNYRNDLDTNKAAYMPIATTEFRVIFNHDTVYQQVAAFLDRFKPSVIFSLDDMIGGYGHPDHVFFSGLAVEYCQNNRYNTGFTVQRIYQEVFTPSMSEAIIVKHSRSNVNPYTVGKEIYHCNGMPVPDVSIDISEWGKNKKAYMNGFTEHDRKNISKFFPCYSWYPSIIYFHIFDREFFKIISVKEE